MTVRAFTKADMIGSVVMLREGMTKKVAHANGPFYDYKRRDRFWILTFEDSTSARFWEDGKGVVVEDPRAAAAPQN